MRGLALVAGVAALAPAEAQVARSRAPRPVSIPDAWAALGSGDSVIVGGRARLAAGVLQPRTLVTAIESGGAGIWLFSRSGFPPVREGDSLVATGVVARYRGTTEVVAARVRVVPAPAAAPAEPAMLEASAALVAAHEGRLVRVRGRVGAQGVSEGGRWVRLHDAARGDSVTLWVPGTHADPPSIERLRAGDQLEVTGIGAVYRDNPSDPPVAQLLPRRAADVRALGVPRHVYDLALRLMLGAAGATLAVFGGARVLNRRQARALRETRDRYHQLLALSPDAVLVHADGRVLFANPAAARLLGFLDEGALAGMPLERFAGDEALAVLTGTADVGRITGPHAMGRRARTRFTGAGGVPVAVEVATSPCRYHDRDAAVVVARDIGPQLRYERDLRELALLDELTGLHNRRGFLTFAEAELRRARQLGRSAMLVFADLDGLKPINDTWGHAAGDQALCAVAAALREIVGEQGLVARWSGDEFVALVPVPDAMPPVADAPSAEGLAARDAESASRFEVRLRAALARHAPTGAPFAVSATVGARHLPPDGGETLAAALASADAGLYRRRAVSRPRSG